MLINKFDDIAYQNKRFSVFCSKKLKRILNQKYRHDLLLIFAATLASSFWQFENYYNWVEPVKIVVSAFAALMWIYVSFISGFKRRDSFLFLILGYWFIPQVFIIWFSNTPIQEYSRYLDLLSTVSNILVHSPVMFVTAHFNVNWHVIVVILVVICELLFALGYNFRYSLRRSIWYCEFKNHYKEI